MKYILAIDQGTSSSRVLIFDKNQNIVASKQQELRSQYPSKNWVEQDPEEIFESVYQLILNLLDEVKINAQEIASIGITNQRETTVVWNTETNKSIYPAIVWQDKRTAEHCEQLKSIPDFEAYVHEETGLVVDAYFSASKLAWILEHVEGARKLTEAGKLKFGTIDSWLVYKLTQHQKHLTDYTNASRTMLFNINRLEWDSYLLDVLNIPPSMLPEVQSSRSDFGYAILGETQIPIRSLIGDQQAALFGQCAFNPGDVKNTYGTGCFMLMNTGDQRVSSNYGLLSTLICRPDGRPSFGLEGSIFIAGAAVKWLRDGLEFFSNSADSENLAQLATHDDIVVVPSFNGLGAPYWDMYAKGAILGLTQEINKNDITKATLDSIAYQTKDVLDAMKKDSQIDIKILYVDGGASENNYLMQFQSDILNIPIHRPANIESTGQGAAYLAGLEIGFWTLSELLDKNKYNRIFTAKMKESVRIQLYERWVEAIRITRTWKAK